MAKLDDALQIMDRYFHTFNQTILLQSMIYLVWVSRDVPIILGQYLTRITIKVILKKKAIIYSYFHEVLSMALLSLKLLRQYRLTNIQIYQTTHLQDNKDILLHQLSKADADDDFGFNETSSFYEDAKNLTQKVGVISNPFF